MAFYKDINKQDRQQKRQNAEQRGGFDDEGRNYSGAKKGAGPARTHDRPQRSGAVRFVKGAPQTYRDRGAGTTPMSYADSRQAQRDSGATGGRYERGNAQGRYEQSDRPQGGYGRGNAQNAQGERFGRGGQAPQGGYGRGGAQKDRFERGNGPRGDRFEQGNGQAPQGDRFERNDRPQGGFGRGNGQGGPRGDINRTRGGNPDMNRGRFDVTRAPHRDEGGALPVHRDAPRARRVPGEFAPEAKDYNAFRYQAAPARPVPAPVEEDMAPENMLCGRNPIREALKSGRDIEKLLVQKGELSGSAREILQLAHDLRVPVQEVEKAHLDALARSHQGMIAYASAYQYHTVEDMLALAAERGEAPFLVLLDGITDPHNLGAIIRTAECAGAHGVIVSERRAVGLTPAAVKASAGAVEHLPVARVVNLSQTLEELKAQGIWSFAADMEGEDYRKVDFAGPVALIIGAEGEGVSRLLLSKCDHRVSLPQKGEIQSLNASVAAGVLMYHILESR